MNIIEITWKDFGIMVDELAGMIKGDFDGIYPIPRGGLPLGVALSHRLNLPLLEKPTENSLVVDDISDEGNTLSQIKGKAIACLHSSLWTKTKPDWHVAIKNDKNDWIKYPWETDLS